MKNPNSPQDLDSLPVLSFPALVMLLFASALGVLAAVVLLPAALPNLAASLLGPEPKAYWYLARSSAWAAYFLLWLAMALGLLITSKAARIWPGGPVAYDIHQFASLLSLAVALFHGLILTGDRYINFSIIQVLIPFSNPDYRPLWVGVGQMGFYLLGLVGLSFYIRRTLTPRIWRLLHFFSFLTYLFVLLHGITSGTDTAQPWAIAAYWLTGGSILFLTVYRIANSVLSRLLAPPPARPDAARA
jgi:predicted ferric reductase